MRILIAADKFKGSMSGAEACAAIARGLPASEVEVETLPVADGGEGISESLCSALGGEWIECEVRDALHRKVIAGYALAVDRGLAVIEMSQASGLWRIEEGERDPWTADTYGTGEMMRDAFDRGAREIILGLGGSATNDGGLGMAAALAGLPPEADEGRAIAAAIDGKILPQGVRVTAACDVRNPLLGDNGCTAVYGPQKGIEPVDYARHEDRLRRLVTAVAGGGEMALVPGAGAAGGLGFGCLAFLRAQLRPGFDLVAEAIDLQAAMERADLVITGEGSIDSQSLEGKAPAGVAEMARRMQKPVVAFAGAVEEAVLEADVFDRVWKIQPPGVSVAESMARGAELLEKAAEAAWFELRVLR